MNLMMGQTKFNEAVKKFDDMAIPLGWIENVNQFILFHIACLRTVFLSLSIDSRRSVAGNRVSLANGPRRTADCYGHHRSPNRNFRIILHVRRL